MILPYKEWTSVSGELFLTLKRFPTSRIRIRGLEIIVLRCEHLNLKDWYQSQSLRHHHGNGMLCGLKIKKELTSQE